MVDSTRLFKRVSEAQLSIDVAQQRLAGVKKNKQLLNEEISKINREIQDTEGELGRASERQIHLIQTLNSLRSQNNQAQSILEQMEEEMSGRTTAVMVEEQHGRQKLKSILLQHVREQQSNRETLFPCQRVHSKKLDAMTCNLRAVRILVAKTRSICRCRFMAVSDTTSNSINSRIATEGQAK